MVFDALLYTLSVVGIALLLSFAIGSYLGVLCARRPGRGLDKFLPSTLMFIGGFPYFWLAMVSVAFLGFHLDLFPLRHAECLDREFDSSFEKLLDLAWHAALPIGTIVIASLGGWLLTMRNAMIGELSSDFVQLAHAKRITWSLCSDALCRTKRATAFGDKSKDGDGLYRQWGSPDRNCLFVSRARSSDARGHQGQDYPLLQGCFAAVTLVVLLSNLLVDSLYGFVDPRTRESQGDPS